MPVGQSSALARTRFAAGLSLGIFMLALESERLSALVHVGGNPNIAPIQASLGTLVFFIAGVVLVCLRPPRKPAPAAAICVVAFVCSLAVASLFFLQRDPALFPVQFLGDLAFSLSPPVLVFFWLQRCMPFGKSFVIESFGMAAVKLGCLSILTIVLEHSVALVLVTLLPLAGAALLCTIEPAGACGGVTDAFAENGPQEHAGNRNAGNDQDSARWSALRAMGNLAHHDSENAESTSLGKLVRNALVRLVPFFCYALLFGSVHFSWLAHQDEASVGVWVQLGASVGTILCGLAALALSHIRWGRAFENIAHLLLTVFAIVALWLSTFLTSKYVFAYLVLLNIAQKLTFMLMLVFGFPFARTSPQRTSIWSVAYLSFFAGTCVSSLLGACTVTVLNIVCAGALAILLLVDIAGIAALYSMEPHEDSDRMPALVGTEDVAPNRAGIAGFTSGKTGAGPSGTDGTHLNVEGTNGGMLADGTSSLRSMDGGSATSRHEAQQPSNTFDQLPYTCHLIAVEYDLTRREEEILQLLVRGRTASRIAETLCITTATTRTHLRNIYAKLGVHSQQDILDMYEELSDEQQG